MRNLSANQSTEKVFSLLNIFTGLSTHTANPNGDGDVGGEHVVTIIFVLYVFSETNIKFRFSYLTISFK